jgi:hypothetical protein
MSLILLWTYQNQTVRNTKPDDPGFPDLPNLTIPSKIWHGGVRDRLSDELPDADVLAWLGETGLSGLVFQMVQFLWPLMPALPSLYLAIRMSKVSFGRHYGLLPLFFCHWPSFGLFLVDHSWQTFLSYDNVLALGLWDGQTRTFFPSSSTMFMFVRNGSLSSFIWGLSVNFNHPSFMVDWTCRWKTLQSLVAWE